MESKNRSLEVFVVHGSKYTGQSLKAQIGPFKLLRELLFRNYQVSSSHTECKHIGYSNEQILGT
jgi:hypothetical protein